MSEGSHFIEMVADGDLRLVEITPDGPRFDYAEKGLAKFDRHDRPEVPGTEIQGVLLIGSILLIGCVLVDIWCLLRTW